MCVLRKVCLSCKSGDLGKVFGEAIGRVVNRFRTVYATAL
jgi:predicted RNA-binding protein YlqC (UPF0109 family)